MKILMRTLAAGPDVIRHPGKVYDVSEAEGKAFCDGGYASDVTAEDEDSIEDEDSGEAEAGAPETAIAEAPEDAGAPRARRGRHAKG